MIFGYQGRWLRYYGDVWGATNQSTVRTIKVTKMDPSNARKYLTNESS